MLIVVIHGDIKHGFHGVLATTLQIVWHDVISTVTLYNNVINFEDVEESNTLRITHNLPLLQMMLVPLEVKPLKSRRSREKHANGGEGDEFVQSLDVRHVNGRRNREIKATTEGQGDNGGACEQRGEGDDPCMAVA
ncbi:hypothetical protein CR513_49881, partial [Mucuna pruriens]